jgi:adenylate kinase
MRLILLGPPGSGKGTQAKLLSTRLALTHLATGDILRDAIQRRSEVGVKAEPFVTSGQLVPDDVVNELVAELFRRDDRPERFVLDGYPRTLAQAASFDQVLLQQYLALNAVVLLRVDDTEIIERNSKRLTCPSCKATYHETKRPPRQKGVCDACGTALVQREDDKEETIRRRLEVYRCNVAEMIPHYRATGLLREVSGEGDVEQIHASIVRALGADAIPR